MTNHPHTTTPPFLCCEAFLCLGDDDDAGGSIRDDPAMEGQKVERSPIHQNEMAERRSDTENVEDSENLDDLLENMDIDKDFDVLGNDDDDDSAEEGETADAVTSEGESLVVGDPLDREEIFSRKYKPTIKESEALNEIAIQMGLIAAQRQSSFFASSSSLFASFRAPRTGTTTTTSTAKSASENEAWNELMQGSVLIQFGSGTLVVKAKDVETTKEEDGKNTEEDQEGTSNQVPEDELKPCEICLLTRGLAVVASDDAAPPIVLTWPDIARVDASSVQNQFTISTQDEITHTIHTPLASWQRPLETCIWRFHEQHCSATGWPYRVVYRQGFTEAVTNEAVTSPLDTAPPPDDWNGLTPLQYAVKCHHLEAAAALLDMGGVPVDQTDTYEHTALYWAQHEAYDDMADLLRQHGAQPVPTQTEELFDRVTATEHIIEERKIKEELQQQAAMSEMQNNRQLLQERGEKIADMGDKANAMNAGAEDYANMTRQLKATLQQRNNRWGLF